MNAPYFYDYQNSIESVVFPSTVKISNTAIAYTFKKYLLQKAMSVFKWEIPDNWVDPYYHLYCLYTYGYFCVLNTDKFGVIPQQCGLSGYGVFYQPVTCLVNNPLLKKSFELTINKNCILIRLQPDYRGILDLISIYGDVMALCLESGSVNLLNSRLSYIAYSQNKAQAETYKKIMDEVLSGVPAVVTDKSMKLKDVINDKPLFELFNTDVGRNFLADKIFTVWGTLENMFDTQIGIPSANTEKRERMISAEIKVGSVETYSRCDLWLEELKRGCRKIKEMFGIDVSVDWRYPPELSGMGGEEGVRTGANQSFNTVS